VHGFKVLEEDVLGDPVHGAAFVELAGKGPMLLIGELLNIE
jgi:hypothetical protein